MASPPQPTPSFLRQQLLLVQVLFQFVAAADVSLYIDKDSWLSFAFPLGTRSCPKTVCTTLIYDPSDSALSSTRETHVYATSFGGRPSPIILPSSSGRKLMEAAVVFMENDARFIPGGEAGLASLLEETDWWPQLGLALGYAPHPPAPLRGPPDHLLRGPAEWRQLSYIDDPVGHFAAHSPVPWAAKMKGVAFFSSQCLPSFAAPRLDMARDLVRLLGDKFHSYGECYHTANLEENLPECIGLPVRSVCNALTRTGILRASPHYSSSKFTLLPTTTTTTTNTTTTNTTTTTTTTTTPTMFSMKTELETQLLAFAALGFNGKLRVGTPLRRSVAQQPNQCFLLAFECLGLRFTTLTTTVPSIVH